METCFPAKCYQKFQKLSTMMNGSANQIRTILIMGEEPENKKWTCLFKNKNQESIKIETKYTNQTKLEKNEIANLQWYK